MLTDDAPNPNYLPTKHNIKSAMRWLVKDAKTDDALFFHCMGNSCNLRLKALSDIKLKIQGMVVRHQIWTAMRSTAGMKVCISNG